MSSDLMPGLSAGYALTLLMVLAVPPALAQPAPGNAKEQRQSTAQKKMPDKASADARQIKQGQQEARDKNKQKMDAANRDLATGIASGSQGSGATQAKKPSSPGKVTQDARKPALQPQADALKK
jgi:cytoskeletal protein RodZ